MGPFYLLNLLSYPVAGLLVGGFAATIGPQRLVAILAAGLCVLGAGLLPLTVASFRRAIALNDPVRVGVKA
jgi:hypothetical protein